MLELSSSLSRAVAAPPPPPPHGFNNGNAVPAVTPRKHSGDKKGTKQQQRKMVNQKRETKSFPFIYLCTATYIFQDGFGTVQAEQNKVPKVQLQQQHQHPSHVITRKHSGKSKLEKVTYTSTQWSMIDKIYNASISLISLPVPLHGFPQYPRIPGPQQQQSPKPGCKAVSRPQQTGAEDQDSLPSERTGRTGDRDKVRLDKLKIISLYSNKKSETVDPRSKESCIQFNCK